MPRPARPASCQLGGVDAARPLFDAACLLRWCALATPLLQAPAARSAMA